ncbi:MAG: UDP-3-O-(3-hydroxymyristoyl)glucosamine N-acyltransferase [Flavobacteriaceae bacterium]|nr:UDP-3-O-(3-hydroxymyristoyl)glucosamine N-acyltransferase [Flavobacteriaceae bacterium]
MKFSKTYSLSEIASILSCKFIGEPDFPVQGMNEIHMVEPGDIVFVDHPKYYDKALASAATIVLINKEVECPQGKALLISEDPFSDFNKLAKHFKKFQPSIQAISPNAKIGENTHIQPNVFIGDNVEIGKDCIIHANVSIGSGTKIGNRVIIHSGSVLGGDAFYYKNRGDHFDKLISTGNVVIEDDVEIGALTTIDRGVSGTTLIGQGTKIDNQVQIGHDTQIGKRCLIASQVGIAGCVVVEDEVTFWGQVGVISGIRIAKGSTFLAQSGVGKAVEEKGTFLGSPAGPFKQKAREIASLSMLPKLIKKLKNE